MPARHRRPAQAMVLPPGTQPWTVFPARCNTLSAGPLIAGRILQVGATRTLSNEISGSVSLGTSYGRLVCGHPLLRIRHPHEHTTDEGTTLSSCSTRGTGCDITAAVVWYACRLSNRAFMSSDGGGGRASAASAASAAWLRLLLLMAATNCCQLSS